MYPEGTVIAGKYVVEQLLGEGGMGTVVAARHLDLGNRLALKFLHPDMAKHASIVERFMREARASAQLQSEHVCRVTDVGRVEATGVPYIVMELLHGQDLSRMLKTQGPLPVAVVAEYLLQACHAVAEAHSVGIVHRDLKPGNLFAVQRPSGKPLIKVLDFGVAKAPTAAQDFSLTQTQNVIGSPGYMSPEQLKSSKVVDARADIWSLGVVLYELLSGKQPFTAESITELAVRVVTEPHPPLPPSIPRALVAIIERCLEKDPARRYPDVAQLAIALAPFAPGGQERAAAAMQALHGGNTMPLAPAPSGPANPTTLRAASGVVEGGARPRSNAVLAGVIGAGIAIGVVVVLLTMRGGDRGGSHAAAPPAPTLTPSVAPPTAVDPAPPVEPPTPVEVATPETAKPVEVTPPDTTRHAVATPADTTRPAVVATPDKPAVVATPDKPAVVATPDKPAVVATPTVVKPAVVAAPTVAKPAVVAAPTVVKPAVVAAPTVAKPAENKPVEKKPGKNGKKPPTVEDLSDLRK